MSPFFSVIIPSYNRADLILKTIESVLQQSYSNFELIVVDDGSKDNTDDVVKTVSDSRFYYFKRENSERGATRNFGISKAKGKYITFIDSDDLMYHHALLNAHDNLTKNEAIICYAQAFEVIDSSTTKQLQPPTFLSTPILNDAILKGNFLGCIGVFVQNSILQTINFEEDRMFAGTEDWLLWLKLASRYPFYYSNVVCAAMIEHQNRSVLSFSEDKLMYRTNTLKKKLLEDEVFVAQYGKKNIQRIYGHMLSYTSLHLAMSGLKMKALSYFIKSIFAHFPELFTRRTLGIFKTILLK